MKDTMYFSVSNIVSLFTLCVFRQLGMLAESMSVGFPLRQMNRLSSTFFFQFFPLKYVQQMILTLIYYHVLQSVATFFSQVMAAVGGNTAGPGT